VDGPTDQPSALPLAITTSLSGITLKQIAQLSWVADVDIFIDRDADLSIFAGVSAVAFRARHIAGAGFLILVTQ
jgi:hypothetical protein